MLEERNGSRGARREWTPGSLGGKRSSMVRRGPVVSEKQSRLVCVELLDSGLVVCMWESLCNLVCQQKDFVFNATSLVEEL